MRFWPPRALIFKLRSAPTPACALLPLLPPLPPPRHRQRRRQSTNKQTRARSYGDKARAVKEGGLSAAYGRRLKEAMEHATQFPEE